MDPRCPLCRGLGYVCQVHKKHVLRDMRIYELVAQAKARMARCPAHKREPAWPTDPTPGQRETIQEESPSEAEARADEIEVGGL